MSKKRGKKNDERDGPSNVQTKLSKFFAHQPVKRQNTKRNAAGETEDTTAPAEKVPKLKESFDVSGENIKLLPETSKRLRTFAFVEDCQPVPASTVPEKCAVRKTEGQPEKILDSSSSAPVLVADSEDEGNLSSKSSSQPSSSNSAAKQKYTPLELQYLELKEEYSDAILFIQCGYKYRIFGEDAQLASKELGFGCYMNHNFLSSSFPTHRLPVHVRRLVSKGYKVGVVDQTETAATKAAGDTKNTLFSRKLTALYTQSTLVGEGFDSTNCSAADGIPDWEVPSVSGYLMCICDRESKVQKKHVVDVGVVAVNAVTGDVLYAAFDDFISRSELESCFAQINPVELLLPNTALSGGTENLVKNMCEMSTFSKGMIRVERMDDKNFDFSEALPKVSDFYSAKTNSDKEAEPNGVKEVLSLPPLVICCLSALTSYLKEFGLESLLHGWRHFKPLHNSAGFMTLNAIAVRNLELLSNCVDYREEGSLLWTINFTSTKFGEKLLKSWLLKPLRDIQKIEERQDSVSSVVYTDSPVWDILKKMLAKMPDLERLLCAAFYHRCSCTEFLNLAKTLTEVKRTVVGVLDSVTSDVKARGLKDIILNIPFMLENVESFVTNLDENAASEENKTRIFNDLTKFPKVLECKKQIKQVEGQLAKLQVSIAKTLRLPAFQYVTVMGQKYLIEVKNGMTSLVPQDWLKISSTKQVSRYRSPEVSALCTKLQQLTEELALHCNDAWHAFLDDFGANFYKYKKAVSQLGELDCIFSLAMLAKQDGFCRPTITSDEERKLDIIQGRNPIVCKLLGERQQYVANDTNLDSVRRCMVITGPNMGGKSSYVRQVALIAILAQMGTYVPAVSASLPLFDGVYVRMGAEDNIFSMRSTFMTEMCETSTILSSASSNSLVILDELGRGTSTHDGAAIAHAVLHHVVTEVKCITLFVTHYPHVASHLCETFPDNVYTCHMAFYVECANEEEQEDVADVTFLYSTTSGVASKSYGINVARLAGIPREILAKAKCVASELESSTQHQRSLQHVIQGILSTDDVLEAKHLCSSLSLH